MIEAAFFLVAPSNLAKSLCEAVVLCASALELSWPDAREGGYWFWAAAHGACATARTPRGMGRFLQAIRSRLRRRDAPSLLGPNYLHLYTLARATRGFLQNQGGRVLDLGADESPYRAFIGRQHTYFSLDINRDCRPHVHADIVHLPVQTGSVDLVICTQAAECVDDPRQLTAECHRVLRPGGTIIFSVPFIWPNQPTPETDNYRFTTGSIRRLFGTFAQVDVRPNGNSWVTLAQMASRCVYQTIGGAGVPFFLVSNVLGRFLDKLPLDSCLATGYTVRAVKSSGPITAPARTPAAVQYVETGELTAIG